MGCEKELLEEEAEYQKRLSDAISEGRDLEQELIALREKKAFRDEMLARAASAEYLEKSVIDIMNRLKTYMKSFIDNIPGKQQDNGEGSSATAANTTGAVNKTNTKAEHQDLDLRFLDDV